MAEKKTSKKQAQITYKGKPISRCGKILYLGDLGAPFFSMLQIITTKQVKDLEVADKVAVQLISNDQNLGPRDRVIKKGMRDGLYNALDIASIWIDQYTPKNTSEN